MSDVFEKSLLDPRLRIEGEYLRYEGPPSTEAFAVPVRMVGRAAFGEDGTGTPVLFIFTRDGQELARARVPKDWGPEVIQWLNIYALDLSARLPEITYQEAGSPPKQMPRKWMLQAVAGASPLPGLLHPLGLFILGTSAVLAGGLSVVAPWSERALWMVVWGGIAYSAVAVTVHWRPKRHVAATPSPLTAASRESDERRPNHPPRETTLTVSFDEFLRYTGEAMRQLKNPGNLAQCPLAAQVPRTLARHLAGGPSAHPQGELTPLLQGHALRAALIEAIARLRPNEDETATVASQTLQYEVLHREYVLGESTSSIAMKLSVSERTLHRYRRDGILAVARELFTQEQLLGKASD